MNEKKWIWMPHAGHLIVGDQCRFHLNTYVGNGYIVSTVGEYWPDSCVRRIHAQTCNPDWYEKNKNTRGDFFDSAYFKQFGFEEIGLERKYETIVFKAIPIENSCCQYKAISGNNIDFDGYNDPMEAYKGHIKLCEKWSLKNEK